MKRTVLLIMVTVLFSFLPCLPSYVLAQDACEGNFDYDKDVDGTDAATFKSDFGRSPFQNPCPDDGPAPVARTGQTASYIKGDDGYYEKGVAWPYPRFRDNGDGTVTDKLTGLMWLKDANCITSEYKGFDNDDTPEDGRVTWNHAFDFINGINDGTYVNCAAGYTGWRLPTLNELHTLIYRSFENPPVPNTTGTGQWSEGDPFNNVAVNSYGYWSSSTREAVPYMAWGVEMTLGSVFINDKGYWHYVWPVRGGW